MRKKNTRLIVVILIIGMLGNCSFFLGDKGVAESYTFYSSSLRNLSTVMVYYPEDHSSSSIVIYLLNGFGADATAWGSGIDLADESSARDVIFVSLSAGSNSYLNNPDDRGEDYEDYVLEVASKVENEYDLEIDSTRRALCGISNGGGGALYILSEHPDQYMAAGSLSGSTYSSMEKYENMQNKGIRMDVGTEDGGVLSSMRWLHDRLEEENVDHEYYEHKGDHDWDFWAKYAPKQFDYLIEYLEGL